MWSYDIAVTDKNEIILSHLKSSPNTVGETNPLPACYTEDARMGLYKISKEGIYELVKEDVHPTDK